MGLIGGKTGKSPNKSNSGARRNQGWNSGYNNQGQNGGGYYSNPEQYGGYEQDRSYGYSDKRQTISSSFGVDWDRGGENTAIAIRGQRETGMSIQQEEEMEAVRVRQDEKLISSLEYADRFVSKNYLNNLGQYEVISPDVSFDFSSVRIIKVSSLMLDKDEDVNEKLTSIYGAIHSINATLFILIRSNGNKVEFYLGTKSSTISTSLQEDILTSGIKGQFPGSKIEYLEKEKAESLLKRCINTEDKNIDVATVTTIPSDRSKDSENSFIQGIEKLIDALKGQKYTVLLIAEPLSQEAITERKLGLQRLYSTISPFSKTSLTYGENYSYAVNKGISEGLTESINYSVSDSNSEGTSHTTSESDTESISKGTTTTESHGSSEGSSVNWGDGFGTSSGMNSGVSRGRSKTKTKSHSVSESYGTSSTFSHSVTQGTGESVSTTKTEGQTDTSGNSRTLTINHENRAVMDMMQKIKEHLDRLKNCEAYGLWSTSAYFIGDVQTATSAAALFRALITGEDSRLENSYINFWRGSENNVWLPNVLGSLQQVSHPIIRLPASGELWEQEIKPTTMVSGKELPLVLGMPRKSVAGILVDSMASFGRNTYYKNALQAPKEKDQLRLGNVMHKGVEDKDANVYLDLQLFRSHVFITGSTGSGKSNTTYQLLGELYKKKIPFLVVEPAKGEYKYDLGNIEGLNVFWTNPTIYPLLRLNPFRFPEGAHVLEHLDRLIDIFNTCWPLYSAMPAILKAAVQNAYISCGWDLINSIRIDETNPRVFPNFEDLERELVAFIDKSEYSNESKGEYKGALVTRVQSLTTGIMGQVFCSPNDIDDTVLFDEYTVIDLSRATSTETKALIMGILVTRLNEYRAATATTTNAKLKHVTVLEEAHNLLKRVSPGSGSEIQQKSVEMLSSSIAEMRTYGEGFMIIDQSPSAVDISAIKNTNTKIVMNLPLEEDFQTIGGSFALSPEQVTEISKLGNGETIVKQSSWLEAMAVKVLRFDENRFTVKEEDKAAYNRSALIAALGSICMEIYNQLKDKCWDVEKMKSLLDGAQLNIWKRKEYEQLLDRFEWKDGVADNTELSCLLMELTDCKGMFDVMPLDLSLSAKEEKDLSGEDKMAKRAEITRHWLKRIGKAFDAYAVITDKVAKKRILEYLIYYMAVIGNKKIYKDYFIISKHMRNKQ